MIAEFASIWCTISFLAFSSLIANCTNSSTSKFFFAIFSIISVVFISFDYFLAALMARVTCWRVKRYTQQSPERPTNEKRIYGSLDQQVGFIELLDGVGVCGIRRLLAGFSVGRRLCLHLGEVAP
jgi:hypothetical protein